MEYTPIGWINNQPPAINATNLNHIDEGIIACVTAINALTNSSAHSITMSFDEDRLTITLQNEESTTISTAFVDIPTALSFMDSSLSEAGVMTFTRQHGDPLQINLGEAFYNKTQVNAIYSEVDIEEDEDPEGGN